MENEPEPVSQEPVSQEQAPNMESVLTPEGANPAEMKLVDVEVTDDNVSLNLMVAFLNLAQKRGAFGIDESAKIWECVKRFIQK